jgi:hypothetical protein
MSEDHLQLARTWWRQVNPNGDLVEQIDLLQAMAGRLLAHLESVAQVQPHRHRLWVEPSLGKHLTEGPWLEAEPREETPQSETPSSEATVKWEETSDTSITSYTWSSRASQAGILPQSVQQATSASYSLHPTLGDEQVEVTLSIRTRKGSTPPDGSHSPSTEAQVPARNGAAGEAQGTGRSARIVELAWGLIAKAYNGEWANAPEDWRKAAIRWRDMYTPKKSHESEDSWRLAMAIAKAR